MRHLALPVLRVVPLEHRHRAPVLRIWPISIERFVENDHVGADTVQEPPVVGDNDGRAGEGLERLL